MQSALLPAALLSSEFRFITVNRPLTDMVQMSAAQLRRCVLFDLVDTADREGVRSFAESVGRMKQAALCQREFRMVCGTERRNALLVMRRTAAADGAEARYTINVVDLSDVATTEQERAHLLEKIEQAAAEWRGTFDAVEMPIIIVGRDLAVLRINRAARMLAGKTYEEIVGMSLRDFPQTEPWISIADLSSRVQENRAPVARQVRDTSARTLDLLAMLFHGDDPADDRVIVIAWDVSALVDLQSRLEQQRQMATMGALVAGVAHEVRNPLFAISATIDALEQTATADLSEYFDVLREEIGRMTTLMQDLLAYGRPAAPVFTEVEVREIVELAARACSPAAARQRVDIVVTSVDGLTVVADRDRLERAVENLVLNAVQHSPQGTTVRVDAARVHGARSDVVTIRVRDQGKGFTREDLPRVFEPFFSRRKGGTGLGLALVQQIVTEHGGEVVASNAEGGGAEVAISIPSRKSHAAE